MILLSSLTILKTSTDVINTGLSYEEYITTSTTYFILPLFNGCTGGSRIPITINVFDSPIANDITIVQCDDEEADGISSFNLSNYTDDIIRRPDGFVIPIWDIIFFEDELLENQIDTTNYVNNSNNQVIYAYVIDDTSGCFNVSEVTLQVNSVPISSSLVDPLFGDGGPEAPPI